MIDLTNYEIPTFEEKVKQCIDVLKHYLRGVFMTKRMMVDDGINPDDVNKIIADLGQDMDAKFMSMPYEEFRDEIWNDIRERMSATKDFIEKNS